MTEQREITVKAWELTLMYTGPLFSNVAAVNASHPNKPMTHESRINDLAPIADIFCRILTGAGNKT